jgi:hypothetical protein
MSNDKMKDVAVVLKKEVCRFLVLVLFLVSVPLTTIGFTEDAQAAGAVNALLWQLGKADQSAAEFKASGTGVEAVQVPSDWSVCSDWSFFPQGLKADRNKELSISYTLASVPANGVELSFKILDAYKITPQMAVFSNNIMAGLIQIAGVGGTSSVYPYQKTYRLYIPKELLQKGTNVLKLQASRDLYASSAGDAYLWWTWDYVALSSLGAPATEPIHGRYTRLGTNIMQDDFYYNDNATTHLPYLLKWLGIAYSGNTNRFALWSDLGPQPESLNYVQTLARYNMQAAADYLHTGTASVDGNYQLDAASKAGLASFFETYGKWVQYYEIDNEPGLFNRSKAVNLAVAQFVQSIKPSHVRTVAPGWAYWPEGGDPGGWERDPVQRKQIEDYTDLTSGHSYGVSNVDDQGGSFTENLRTYKGAADGLPKEMLVTETGSEDAHTDFPFVGSLQPHASVFDRILRAHIGYADQTIQHAAFFHESYSLFQGGFNWSMHDPATTAAFPGVNGEDTRLKSYRRLALAYATHGAPLSYTYTNKAAIEGKKVYFRAVNTATLAPLPGSGATADKVLLNFVNFEPTAQTMSVRVTMPSSGVYEGERIGQGSTYAAAKSIVSGLNAQPSVDLSVTLGAGESVQYILSRQSTVAIPSAPAKLWLSMEVDKPQLSWSELDGAVTYTVKRATGTGSYTTLASGLTGTSYIDFTAHSKTAYTYVVSATNAKGSGGDSPPVQTAISYSPVIEAEDALLGGGASVSNDGAASGGKKVGNLHYGGSFVSADFDGGSGGTATLKVLYAKGDAGLTTKSLFINGVDTDTLNFVNTGGWGEYKEMVMPITLRKGVNTVMIKQDGGDTGGADLDMLTVVANLADDDEAKPPTASPTASATPVASPTASATPVASPTASATPVASPTASATPVADTTAPSLPGNLKVIATGETTAQLGWTAAWDQNVPPQSNRLLPYGQNGRAPAWSAAV